MNTFHLNNKQITLIESTLIILSSLSPLFFSLHYTANIYLTWEGAFRLYLGQIPYKDFGLTVGFGFLLIPTIFFKLVGPYLFTLVKAQVFINIVSAFAFRSILNQFTLNPGIRLLSVFLYIISFSSYHIWPWYNHTVIVFEFVGFAFLLHYIFLERKKYRFVYLFASCFFLFLSFFTKQDAGALAFIIAAAIITCHAFYARSIRPIALFIALYCIIGMCFFLPFMPYHISYWFNYGQEPHNARINLYDVFNLFFTKAAWAKFYILLIILIWFTKLRQFKELLRNKKFIIFSLLVLGILFESVVIQVTSFTTEFNYIFLHSFAIAYIFSYSGLVNKINFERINALVLTGLCFLIWWSPILWQHAGKITTYFESKTAIPDTSIVSIHSFKRHDPHFSWKTSLTQDKSKWEYAPWAVFKGIKMPKATIEGIDRLTLTNSKIVKNNGGKRLKILNMTELTPLAKVLGHNPETGPEIPLWYHKNVGIFQEQIDNYNQKIKRNYYDIVLFEYIPLLNNFFPFEVRNTLMLHYEKIDSFPAPRNLYYRVIEVYVQKVKTPQ